MPEKKVVHFLLCFCFIWVAFCLGLLRIRNFSHILQIFRVDVLFILVNISLHFLFVSQGTLPWYALPLMWFSCVMPLLYFSYYVEPRMFDTFGEAFVFGFLGVTALAPVVCISLIIGFTHYYMRKS